MNPSFICHTKTSWIKLKNVEPHKHVKKISQVKLHEIIFTAWYIDKSISLIKFLKNLNQLTMKAHIYSISSKINVR